MYKLTKRLNNALQVIMHSFKTASTMVLLSISGLVSHRNSYVLYLGYKLLREPLIKTL